MGVCALLVITVFTRILPLVPLLLVGAFLAADLVVRGDRALRGGMSQYGLGEWLVHRIRDER